MSGVAVHHRGSAEAQFQHAPPARAEEIALACPGGPPKPRLYSVILPHPMPLEGHATLEGLAARLQALRASRGLRVIHISGSYAGCDTFQGLTFMVTPNIEGAAEEYLCSIVVPWDLKPALLAAMRAAPRSRKAA